MFPRTSTSSRLGEVACRDCAISIDPTISIRYGFVSPDAVGWQSIVQPSLGSNISSCSYAATPCSCDRRLEAEPVCVVLPRASIFASVELPKIDTAASLASQSVASR